MNKAPYQFTFGKAVKEARTKRGKSRKKVSDDMDISLRYLANIENKGQQPSLQIFYELDALIDGISDKGLHMLQKPQKRLSKSKRTVEVLHKFKQKRGRLLKSAAPFCITKTTR